MLSSALGVILALAQPAPAPAPDAARLFEQAQALYRAGQYDQAAEMFGRLHQQTGKAALLSPLAQSLRLAGRCPDALAAYQKFLEAGDTLVAELEDAPDSEFKRELPKDLAIARARAVEMSMCVHRNDADQARATAAARLAAGQPRDAIAILDPAWQRTRDPAVALDLASAHRLEGNCDRARALYDETVTQLAPIEELPEPPEPGSDLARAAEVARRARTDRDTFRCMPGPKQPAPAAAVTEAPPPAPPPPPTSRGRTVAVWLGAGGGALILGGGVLLAMAAQTETKLEKHLKTEGWNQEAFRLNDKGKLLNVTGLAVGGAGVLAAAGGLVLYLVTGRTDIRASLGHQGGISALTLGGRF
jgi:tetratricopeptide (TPR) repeat protein